MSNAEHVSLIVWLLWVCVDHLLDWSAGFCARDGCRQVFFKNIFPGEAKGKFILSVRPSHSFPRRLVHQIDPQLIDYLFGLWNVKKGWKVLIGISRKPKMAYSSVWFCPRPKDIQVTVTEEDGSQTAVTFKKAGIRVVFRKRIAYPNQLRLGQNLAN